MSTILIIVLVALLTFAVIIGVAVWAKQEEQDRIAKNRRVAVSLREKGLEVVAVPVSLPQGEVCHFWTSCDLVQLQRTRGVAAYHGLVARIKIAEGVHYRAAILSGGIQVHEEFRIVDSGDVLITNKRVIYRGTKRNNSVALVKALSIRCFEGGTLRIEKDRGPPFIVTNCPAIAMEAIFEMILGRPIQSSYGASAAPSQPDLFSA